MARSTASHFIASGTVNVTSAASQLSTLGYTTDSDTAVFVLSNLSTSESIYFDASSGVTADDATTGGRILGPLDEVRLPYPKEHIDDMYWISTATGARMRITEEY